MMTRGASSLENELCSFEMLTTLATIVPDVLHCIADGSGNKSLWRINFHLLLFLKDNVRCTSRMIRS